MGKVAKVILTTPVTALFNFQKSEDGLIGGGREGGAEPETIYIVF